ncbi:MAG TPA: methyltransferase domain-containing protein [Tepidisphaeraceae bacterium]|nr:methyltransferase domain-containing protein [Tepidisphaeraceae bacterium]
MPKSADLSSTHGHARPRKLKAGAAAKSIAGRVFNPAHLLKAVKLQRGRKQNKRAYDDAQLALLSQIIPGGYLHYGYFDDVDREPREISLAEITRAQQRYAELLVDLADDRESPVLDVGCGMGAMSKLLLDRGFKPTALTPDRFQATHIRQTYPQIPLIECKFEDLPDPEQHAGRYGTVFTSESLQYLKLDRALPLLEKILKPGGRWIACDYFRIGSAHEKSGHRWEGFTDKLRETGWEIAYQRDITPHVLPTLRAAHMWATQFGIPLLKFVELKLRVKQPALHYVLQGLFEQLDGVIDDNLKTIDPAVFASQKKYVLLTMQRASV